MCTICTRVQICTRLQICTREQIYTRVQICTPLCRVHMPINCVHTHLDLIRNLTQGTRFYKKKSLCLNVLNDSNYVLSRCMCVGGRGGASSIFRRRSVWLKLSHSIHIKAKSEKHIHNMTTIFYLNDCISFNGRP